MLNPHMVHARDSPPRQADTDPAGHGTGHPFLAVNGNTDGFALCQHGSQNSVVFKPKAGSTSYDASSCYPIKVQLIYDY